MITGLQGCPYDLKNTPMDPNLYTDLVDSGRTVKDPILCEGPIQEKNLRNRIAMLKSISG